MVVQIAVLVVSLVSAVLAVFGYRKFQKNVQRLRDENAEDYKQVLRAFGDLMVLLNGLTKETNAAGLETKKSLEFITSAQAKDAINAQRADEGLGALLRVLVEELKLNGSALQALNDELKAGHLIKPEEISARLQSVAEAVGAFDASVGRLLPQLRLAAENVRADVSALHGSVASLDFSGIKSGIASLQIVVQAQIAKLHADLATVELSLGGMDLASVKAKVADLERRQTADEKVANRAKLIECAVAGANYAEQQAAVYFKQRGSKMSTQDKVDSAVRWATMAAQKLGLDPKRHEVTVEIETYLGSQRFSTNQSATSTVTEAPDKSV